MPDMPQRSARPTRAEDGESPVVEGLAPVEVQATAFRHVREARRNELVEDYVELIADLVDDGGEARPVDIAARFGVAKPTVNKMLKRLAQEGLITQRPYRAVFLTDAGRARAEESRCRHRVVIDFLLALGVSRETARRDAEGMEHTVSAETLAAMKAYTAKAS
ncbi:MAG: manganese-binding transcriptional regulator MntR [Thalassobaculum sp.]|uniref:manganese-binding transcriptional regulator MntR n=1 Tax=Thalassobaculum sp. TaxID=2022740 RepID=UPI0032EDEAD0